MPTLVVAIATLGRPETVAENLEALGRQTRLADRIILSATSEADLPADLDPDKYEILLGEKGLCKQRNRVLEALGEDVDYLVFFDDDYVPSKFALEHLEAFFESHPDIVGASGKLLADGIKGPGITYEEACAMVEAFDAEPRQPAIIEHDLDSLYGCNMAYRAGIIGDTRFDENLPYYGWLEDNDFSNQLLPHGRLVKTTAFVGVHCGVKSARSPGLRLGYSQIANPIYLNRKGTLPWRRAWRLMSRNFLANHAKTFTPEPWVDRWGRAKGNWLALFHLLTGKLSPLYVTRL